MKFAALTLFIFSLSLSTFGQVTKKVAFLGNSYTYSNDLPGLVSNLAIADGNTLVKAQNTPGGYTFNGHSSNSTSLNILSQDTWDYVVLQEQSQLPSFPWLQASADCFPYAAIICDSMRSANECAIPLFFNTWGRRDGDPQWDSIDTFTEMNQRLHVAYDHMANENSGMLCPVGIGFEHIANDGAAPITFNSLYAGDGSHPAIYGSYLAACMFYEMIFETNVQGNTFVPGGISSAEATYLQDVAHFVLTAVDSVELSYIDPWANFSYVNTIGLEVDFSNLSEHAFNYTWDFGDSNGSNEINPTYIYATEGTYNVTLTAEYCGRTSDTTIVVYVEPQGIFDHDQMQTLEIFPNPSKGWVQITLPAGVSKLEIYNAQGQLIESIETDGHEIILQKQAGIYFVKAGNYSGKLIVN